MRPRRGCALYKGPLCWFIVFNVRNCYVLAACSKLIGNGAGEYIQLAYRLARGVFRGGGGGSGGSGTPLRLKNGRGCQKFRARKVFSTLLQHILDTRLYWARPIAPPPPPPPPPCFSYRARNRQHPPSPPPAFRTGPETDSTPPSPAFRIGPELKHPPR